MATTEQDSGKTYADMWGEAVHANRHLRVLSMGLAGLVLLLVVIIIRLSSVELPKPIVVRVDEVGRAEALAYDAVEAQAAAPPGQQPFPVAVDHARALPPPRLQDGRQRNATGDHILHRPDARAVPGQRVDDVVGKPGVSRHPLVNARHLARAESLPHRAVLPHRPKQPPLADAAAVEPCRDELHGVAREIEHRASAIRIGLARAHQQRGRAVDVLQYIRHVQRHQLRPPQQGVVAYGQERAVPGVDQPVSGRRQ